MTQKAFSEAMRALVLYTASYQDQVMIAEANGEADTKEAKLAAAVNDLLLPIVKGYGSERSWVLLGTESLQTFGGSGFLQEYPIEQYVRDAKIDTLYEAPPRSRARTSSSGRSSRTRAARWATWPPRSSRSSRTPRVTPTAV